MNPRWIAGGLAVVALILLDVRQHVRIVSLGYEIEALNRERDRLNNLNREILIEAETLSALDRIEGIAVNRLGMMTPAEGQVRMISGEEQKGPVETDGVIQLAGGQR